MRTRFNRLATVSGSFQHVQKPMSVNESGKCIDVPLLDAKAHVDGCEWSASRSGRFTLQGNEFMIVEPTA